MFLEVLWNTADTTEYKCDYQYQGILVYYVSAICYNHLTTVMPQHFFHKEPSLLYLLFNSSAERASALGVFLSILGRGGEDVNAVSVSSLQSSRKQEHVGQPVK